MKLGLAVLIFLSSWSAQSTADAEYTGPKEFGYPYFSFQDFQNQLLKNKAETVAQGIQVLPKEFFDSFTLVKAGGALQESNPEFPRAIMFGETAHLIVTFNGSPKQEAYDSIETAEFDSLKKRVLYRAIIFKKESKKPGFFPSNEVEFENENLIVTKPNPNVCSGCHEIKGNFQNKVNGHMMRYLWTQYPAWPMSYGSNDDIETPDFEKMKRKWSKHPRYKLLFQRDNRVKSSFPYYYLDHSNPKADITEIEKFRKARLMPNGRMSAAMGTNFAQQMAEVVLATPSLLQGVRDDEKRFCEGKLFVKNIGNIFTFDSKIEGTGIPVNFLRMDREVFDKTVDFRVSDVSTSHLTFLFASVLDKTGNLDFLDQVLEDLNKSKYWPDIPYSFVEGGSHRAVKRYYLNYALRTHPYTGFENISLQAFRNFFCKDPAKN